MEGLNNILDQFTTEDLEKLKVLFSIVPNSEQKKIITLRVFIEEYKNIISHNRSVNYFKSVSISLKHLTNYFTEQRSIGSITLKDVESFLIYLKQNVRPVARTANRSGEGYAVYYRNLKAAFNKAVDWKYIKENHFIKIKLPKKQKTHPVYINSDQLSAISCQIENDVVRDFVSIAFYTGMRLNEIVNLTWKNVDLNSRIITVGDEEFETKGKNQRYIPISGEVLKALSNQLPEPPLVLPLGKGERNCGYVFTKTNGQKYTGDYFSKRFKRACRAAGMDKAIHFHTLRHSFASNLAQKGVSLYTIKELLGHSSISTTEIYSHLNMDSLKEAISKFDEHQPHPKSLSLVRRGTSGVGNY